MWKHLGKSIPDSIANAKALRQELAEHVLRSTRRPQWPEGYAGREEWYKNRAEREPGRKFLA